jgi:2-hydroxymuconate-semialdehyde hydrolase
VTDAHIVQSVQDFITETFLDGDGDGLTEMTALLQTGVVDSMGMLKLLVFLRDRFQVKLPEEEIRPENLVNIRAIAALVGRYRA